MKVKISEDCTDYEGVLAGKIGTVVDLDWYSMWPKLLVRIDNFDNINSASGPFFIKRNDLKSCVEDMFENMARVHINGVDRTTMFKDFEINKENTKMTGISENIKALIRAKFAKDRDELDKKQSQDLYDYKLNSKAGKEFIKFKKSIGKFNDENPLYGFSEDWLNDEDKKCMKSIYKKHRDEMYNIDKYEAELEGLLEAADNFEQKLQLLNLYGVTNVHLC